MEEYFGRDWGKVGAVEPTFFHGLWENEHNSLQEEKRLTIFQTQADISCGYVVEKVPKTTLKGEG